MQSGFLSQIEMEDSPMNDQWIVADADHLGGKPRVRGTRISMAHLLEMLACGMSIQEIVEAYPSLSEEAIKGVLEELAELELMLGTEDVKTIDYKGFIAQVMFYKPDQEFIGAITNAQPEHAIYFSGIDIFELKSELHKAVDAYLAECAASGIEPYYTPEEGEIVTVTLDDVKADTETDWERLDQMTDREITLAALSDSDAPPLTAEDLKRMKPVRWINGKRQELAIIPFRVDKDLLKWFTRFGADYQVRMNEVLRGYMEAHR
jgi:uncharacterized protein (DUF433 family)/uncharacterized protein (DUF4415 family)/predicted HicB family RNase H-like nuclease